MVLTGSYILFYFSTYILYAIYIPKMKYNALISREHVLKVKFNALYPENNLHILIFFIFIIIAILLIRDISTRNTIQQRYSDQHGFLHHYTSVALYRTRTDRIQSNDLFSCFPSTQCTCQFDIYHKRVPFRPPLPVTMIR